MIYHPRHQTPEYLVEKVGFYHAKGRGYEYPVYTKGGKVKSGERLHVLTYHGMVNLHHDKTYEDENGRFQHKAVTSWATHRAMKRIKYHDVPWFVSLWRKFRGTDEWTLRRRRSTRRSPQGNTHSA